ncbi:MAG: rhomboid family intramembrane serine protease [Bdellovibrio sp.]
MRFQMTPMVKGLLVVHVGVWLLLQVILEGYGGLRMSRHLQLVPAEVFFEFSVWQLLTYIFLHSLNIGHLLFNMLTLWLIGTELEERWGKHKFLFFYLATGIGAGVLYTLGVVLFHLIFGGERGLVTPVIGASGAIFGLLLAYAWICGERTLHFMLMFPMKAKHFVWLLGAVEFLSLLSSGLTGSGVAYLAHLGGLLSGYLALLSMGYWSRLNWTTKLRRKNQKLRLVVDNEKDQKTPKYWN